jgi:hypothetical protein
LWPGYDLRKIPGRDEFHYGFLPSRFFNEVFAAVRALPQAEQNDDNGAVRRQG